jgi:hypothetical protein
VLVNVQVKAVLFIINMHVDEEVKMAIMVLMGWLLLNILAVIIKHVVKLDFIVQLYFQQLIVPQEHGQNLDQLVLQTV